jgi:hypothetical protein
VKKKILGILAAIAVLVTVLLVALPVHASPGVLDHLQITPTSATVPVGRPVQFLAQGYDSSDNATNGLIYSWSVSGGGTIGSTGLFIAGTTAGKFTVQVTTTQGSTTKTATAQVKVNANPLTPTVTNLETKKLNGLLGSYLNSVGFSNFLGGRWQVKNGTGTDTIQVMPGVIQSVSSTSLIVLVNGQTIPSSFVLPTNTVILPKGTQLANNDNVAVVTINNQVNMVVKITSPSTSEQGTMGDKRDDSSWFHRSRIWKWAHGGKANHHNVNSNGHQE